MGCVMQVGEQSTNIARNAILSSRLPESVPGTSVDRQCGSSQQALHFAAQAVMSGTQDIVIAAGVESMTRVPMGLSVALPAKNGFGVPKSPRQEERYPNIQFSQFAGAEMVAKKYGLNKEQLDEYAYHSHQRRSPPRRAARSRTRSPRSRSRTPRARRACTRSTKASASTPARRHQGRQAAAGRRPADRRHSSQICDGASGVMIVSERRLKTLGLEPMARIHHLTLSAAIRSSCSKRRSPARSAR